MKVFYCSLLIGCSLQLTACGGSSLPTESHSNKVVQYSEDMSIDMSDEGGGIGGNINSDPISSLIQSKKYIINEQMLITEEDIVPL